MILPTHFGHYVLCLRQLTDVIFAVCDLRMLLFPLFLVHRNLEPLEVDSISAIVAQIPDLFLVPTRVALAKHLWRAFSSNFSTPMGPYAPPPSPDTLHSRLNPVTQAYTACVFAMLGASLSLFERNGPKFRLRVRVPVSGLTFGSGLETSHETRYPPPGQEQSMYIPEGFCLLSVPTLAFALFFHRKKPSAQNSMKPPQLNSKLFQTQSPPLQASGRRSSLWMSW